MKKNIVNNIIFATSLGLFALIISRYGVGNLLDNFSKTGFWLIPIVAVWGIVYLLNTYAFKSVLIRHKVKIPFSKVFTTVLTGYSLNYITPIVALGGELYKINILKEYIGKAHATSVIVKYYIMHILSHIAFWILGFILLIFNMEQNVNTLKLITLTAIFIGLISLLFVLVIKKNVLVKVYNAILKMPLPNKLKNLLISKEQNIIDIDAQIKDFYSYDKKNFYKALILEFTARVIASLEILFILWSLGFEFTVFQAIYLSSISSLLLNILFFIPMQMGSREGIYYLITYSMGITSPIGVYISLTSRIREFIWIFFGLILIPISKNKANLEEQETELEEDLIINEIR